MRRWITPPEWDDRDFDNPVDPFRQGVGDPYSRLDHLDGLSAPVRARAVSQHADAAAMVRTDMLRYKRQTRWALTLGLMAVTTAAVGVCALIGLVP